MNDLLKAATAELERFLSESLPKISAEWWTKHVIDRLSFQQQRLAQERRFTALRDLDFAALLIKLDPPPKFDLVIVDEAHHIRNSETYLHQGVRYFCDNADAVVFLSATLIQLGRPDLFTLLNVLRPDLIIDHASFEQMAEPNGFINAAVRHCRQGQDGWASEARSSLDEAAQTEWGRLFIRETPAFQQIYDQLQQESLNDADRVTLTRSIEELYTFSNLINRTRRRDIGEFTVRKPETLTAEFTAGQREVHLPSHCRDSKV